MVMAVMETPHRLARSLRQIITQVQSPSIFVRKDLILLTEGPRCTGPFVQKPVPTYIAPAAKPGSIE
jgi:16S rRNA C1402 (ribose-2'-O) methylase RsmI